jgi:hypothetical protein
MPCPTTGGAIAMRVLSAGVARMRPVDVPETPGLARKDPPTAAPACEEPAGTDGASVRRRRPCFFGYGTRLRSAGIIRPSSLFEDSRSREHGACVGGSVSRVQRGWHGCALPSGASYRERAVRAWGALPRSPRRRSRCFFGYRTRLRSPGSSGVSGRAGSLAQSRARAAPAWQSRAAPGSRGPR